MMRIAGLLLSLLLVLSVAADDQRRVFYPNRDGVGTDGFGYQMFALALSQSGSNYQIVLTPETMNQDRALAELAAGRLAAVDTGMGPFREERFDAVYIPIDRGLTGWRIFIIHRDEAADFAQIHTLAELRHKSAGQGIGWTDSHILSHAGLWVENAATLENLMAMVSKKRFDFLPLGVNEAHGFLAKFGKDNPDLMVEPTLVLTYPFARLFYVRKGDRQLHDDLQRGLERAFANGSFQRLLANHPFFREGLGQAKIAQRTRIAIANPLLTAADRQIDAKWWYNPDEAVAEEAALEQAVAPLPPTERPLP